MKSQIYNQPKYYEVAFSFINVKKQVALFEKLIKKYSKIKVKKILDIACGPALQLREFAKYNYISTGIDCNSDMISYLQNISLKDGLKINAVKADMNNFQLKSKVDFAYILMGSIVYVKNSEMLLSHLTSVAGSLKKGGLYLIENLLMDWTDANLFKPQSWTTDDGKIKIKTSYNVTPKNLLRQELFQNLAIDVWDNGKRKKYIERVDFRIFFPNEFQLLIKQNNQFEFLGFFERSQIKKLSKITSKNIVLLRKK